MGEGGEQGARGSEDYGEVVHNNALPWVPLKISPCLLCRVASRAAILTLLHRSCGRRALFGRPGSGSTPLRCAAHMQVHPSATLLV